MPQPVLELLHVLVGDGVETLCAEHREQVVLQHQLLMRDAARLRLVRARMAVHEARRELFESRDLLPAKCGTADQELALPSLAPALCGGLRRDVEPLPFAMSSTIL